MKQKIKNKITSGVVRVRSRGGMELVQVAIMVAIAVALGLIFRTKITDFVNTTFESLNKFN